MRQRCECVREEDVRGTPDGNVGRGYEIEICEGMIQERYKFWCARKKDVRRDSMKVTR